MEPEGEFLFHRIHEEDQPCVRRWKRLETCQLVKPDDIRTYHDVGGGRRTGSSTARNQPETRITFLYNAPPRFHEPYPGRVVTCAWPEVDYEVTVG